MNPMKKQTRFPFADKRQGMTDAEAKEYAKNFSEKAEEWKELQKQNPDKKEEK